MNKFKKMNHHEEVLQLGGDPGAVAVQPGQSSDTDLRGNSDSYKFQTP